MPRRPSATPALDRRLALLGKLTDEVIRPEPVGYRPDATRPVGWVPQRAAVTGRPLLSSPRSGSTAPGGTAQRRQPTGAPTPERAARTAATAADLGRHRRPAPPAPAVFTLPRALHGAVTRPPRRAVLGLLLVLVLASAVLAGRVVMAHASATPHPVATTGSPPGLVSRSLPAAFASPRPAISGPASPTVAPAKAPGSAPARPTGPGFGSGSGGSSPSTGVALVVDVVGQVKHPGVVHLPTGARVLDAVTAAGGALRSAQTSAVNLARPVVDGEQVVIPKHGQSAVPTGAGAGSVIVPPGAASPASGAGGTPSAVIDLNAADATALDSLPGVGPVLSQRILEWRGQHGRFSSVDELGEVSGIGDKMLAQLTPRVRV